eukprot:1616735-Rhodomonas_salina.2
MVPHHPHTQYRTPHSKCGARYSDIIQKNTQYNALHSKCVARYSGVCTSSFSTFPDPWYHDASNSLSTAQQICKADSCRGTCAPVLHVIRRYQKQIAKCASSGNAMVYA